MMLLVVAAAALVVWVLVGLVVAVVVGRAFAARVPPPRSVEPASYPSVSLPRAS